MKRLDSYDLFAGLDVHTPLKEDVVIWLGLRPGDYKSISYAYPNGVASTRFGKDTINTARKFAFVSVEQNTRTRTDSDLEELSPYLLEFLKRFNGNRVHIVAYHSTPSLERVVSSMPNVRILNSPAALKSKLDKKSYVRRELQKIGVPFPLGHEETLESESYQGAASEYSLPFFVQFNDAASGSGSFLVNNWGDFKDIFEKFRGEQAIFMKYINGSSFNMNLVRTNNFTVLSEPSFQIIGASGCTTRRFGYCGNDFNIESKVSEEELRAIDSIALKVGDWIGSQGYRGIFGIDFISDGKKVYFTEINPRFQGSTALLTDQHLEIGKLPLTLFHLVPFLDDVSIKPESLTEYNLQRNKISASQILVHNTLGRDCIMQSSLAPGRYELVDGRLLYQGPGEVLSDSISTKEIVIAGEIPLDGTRVLRDSDEMYKIFSYKEVLDRSGKGLNKEGRALVEAVNSRMRLQ
ncbi:MAG: ATP-grasp domain-containing protein [Nanoarchaeota archaeon]|nr:ATP-grasp domain-containing protein [Nanoarchaeota archaeon]